MNTSRKITMALSYLRSALEDIEISSPMAALAFSAIIKRIVDFRRIYAVSLNSLIGECYNIRRKSNIHL